MYYFENNRTFGIGTNPHGGAYVEIFCNLREEVEAVEEVFGGGIYSHLELWTWRGGKFFFSSQKIYCRSTNGRGGIPSDGGANPLYERIMEVVKKFDGKKIQDHSELEEVDNDLSASSYAEILRVRAEVLQQRAQLASEGKRHSKCLWDRVYLGPKTTIEELLDRYSGKIGAGHEALLGYLNDKDYKWSVKPDLVYLSENFELDTRFTRYFQYGETGNKGPQALFGIWLRIAREIVQARDRVRMI